MGTKQEKWFKYISIDGFMNKNVKALYQKQA